MKKENIEIIKNNIHEVCASLDTALSALYIELENDNTNEDIWYWRKSLRSAQWDIECVKSDFEEKTKQLI